MTEEYRAAILCGESKQLRKEKILMKIFDDLDKMPFGKHAGIVMQDVPASYLHWLWSNGKEQDKQCPVADYIRRNISSLAKEYSDGIW